MSPPTDDGEGSNFLYHEPCDDCGSSDARAVFDDGHKHCFSCGAHTPAGSGELVSPPKTSVPSVRKGLLSGESVALKKRGLTAETTLRWGYFTTTFKGETVQVAPYRDEDGRVTAQKVRFRDKTFTIVGEGRKSLGLFGKHLWRDGGKRIIICEGEIDAMTVDQVLKYRWPVVSVPNGAQGARKSLAKHLDWLNKFEQIVLCFDNDEPGQKATEDCARLFPPGKVAVVHLPRKDPNDMLQRGEVGALVTALWEAKGFRPDGIVTLAEIREKIMEAPTWGAPWFNEEINALTFGRRLGECVGLGAGTGTGKSDFLAEQIAYDIDVLKLPVGLFLLEQSPQESAKIIAGKLAEKRFHIPDAGWTDEELAGTIDRMLGGGKLFLYDHFGATDWDVIRERIRFLYHSEGVQYFYVDHLTALAAGDDDSEKEALERIMAELASLVKELNIWIMFVSHLTTPEGKPHEEGGRVTIRQFKGSRAIGFWAHVLFGLERNQQAADDEAKRTTRWRLLKNRIAGEKAGSTVMVRYDPTTGRLRPVEESDAPDFDNLDDDNDEF